MKLFTIFTLLLTFIFTANASTMMLDNSQSEDARMCQVFEKKVNDYMTDMRDDKYAKATLESYQNRAKLYCSK